MSLRKCRWIIIAIMAIVGAVAALGFNHWRTHFPAIDPSETFVFKTDVLEMEVPCACTVTVSGLEDSSFMSMMVRVKDRDVLGIGLNVIPEFDQTYEKYDLDTREGVLTSRDHLDGHLQDTVTWPHGSLRSRHTIVRVSGGMEWPGYACFYYRKLPPETAVVANRIITSVRFKEIKPEPKKR